MRFKDRQDAGKKLADLVSSKVPKDAVVLALPRGGVPLGICISKEISAPLDLVLAKKIGHPSHREFAIGAMAEDGKPIFNKDIEVNNDWLENEIIQINKQIKERREMYEDILIKQPLENKVVLIVDDGIATGMTMFAAIEAVKMQKPATIIVAVPIIPKDTYKHLANLVDQVLTLDVPKKFLGAVGAYYDDFSQVSDLEVTTMMTDHFL